MSQNNWHSRVNYQPSFSTRHIGLSNSEQQSMLKTLGYKNIEELVDKAVPKSILDKTPFDLKPAASEHDALNEFRAIMSKNKLFRSYIGMGYYPCVTPPVIQRNILENPGWYTQYTPYQAEIAQGRLEALLNYQTMVCDLTGLEIANASLLDEGTAAAEAMNMFFSSRPEGQSKIFYVTDQCHPQTISVVRARAQALGIEVQVGAPKDFPTDKKPFGLLFQYPATDGSLENPRAIITKAHDCGAFVAAACDLLALCMLVSPGELGADCAVGNSQRFGIPMGYGGPHAAYFATKDAFKRKMPGRLVGLSKDLSGKPALRLALATREQHIRRDKATSNICTAQVLLAIMAGMYAVYHGPEGLRRIAGKVNAVAKGFAAGLTSLGFEIATKSFFDTVRVTLSDAATADAVMKRALDAELNLRRLSNNEITVSFDEVAEQKDVEKLWEIFSGKKVPSTMWEKLDDKAFQTPAWAGRKTTFLTHPVFSAHHSETLMLRYIHKLEKRDLSLAQSMIPLGSCTMKLNATSELMPITWPEVNSLHPFVPLDQAKGYQEMFLQLESWLSEITGFAAVSLQPNSGAQGEYAGLLVINKYHQDRGDDHRNICLIPSSAHGTNPASAVLAGQQVVVVSCDSDGNIDVADLEAKAKLHAKNLSCLMVTYPSTHGVFEESIVDICKIIHDNGGQVYMDGANLQAQIGLCRAGRFGPDVCHMNLHKTFCIPHGGGGPGMGPIAVREHLKEFLPTHPLVSVGGKKGVGPVSAAPWGSASILPISWMYIRMMGNEGLVAATRAAILSANYIAGRLNDSYPVVYRGKNGLVAHECIIDLKPLKKSADIDVDDIAKRLIDYGFHAPTVSWPVPGSMMIEPTESESLGELDRFCEAMLNIRAEIAEIEKGKADKQSNVLKHAPHTAEVLLSDSWDRPYGREKAAYPTEWVKDNKFWPFVGRVDNAFGDRNIVCTCPPLSAYT